ncbi:MAG: hypothetical protein SFU25_00575 [Candidatus Caenarcaniphilales bacterium]|nr:hypothetical protein [Candidatus Caenarcaniphilales bacterium]
MNTKSLVIKSPSSSVITKSIGLGFSLAILLSSMFVSLPQRAEALSKGAKIALGVVGVTAVGVGAYQIGKKRERDRIQERRRYKQGYRQDYSHDNRRYW